MPHPDWLLVEEAAARTGRAAGTIRSLMNRNIVRHNNLRDWDSQRVYWPSLEAYYRQLEKPS